MVNISTRCPYKYCFVIYLFPFSVFVIQLSSHSFAFSLTPIESTCKEGIKRWRRNFKGESEEASDEGKETVKASEGRKERKITTVTLISPHTTRFITYIKREAQRKEG